MKTKQYFLTVGIIILGSLLSGCVGNKAQPEETGLNQQEKQAIAANCKFDKAICDYFVAQAEGFSKSLTMKMSFASKDPEMQGMVTTTKMDGKGNTWVVSAKNGKPVSEMIQIGKDSFIKNGSDTTWLKMTIDSEANPMGNFQEMVTEAKETIVAEESQDKTSFVKIKSENYGAVMCDVYEMTMTDSETTKSTIWIGQKDHLAYKMTTATTDGNTSIIEYDYASVTITAPSPVKEFSMPKLDPKSMESGDFDSAALEEMMKQLPTGFSEEE